MKKITTSVHDNYNMSVEIFEFEYEKKNGMKNETNVPNEPK